MMPLPPPPEARRRTSESIPGGGGGAPFLQPFLQLGVDLFAVEWQGEYVPGATVYPCLAPQEKAIDRHRRGSEPCTS
jgi:hypothetical protein